MRNNKFILLVSIISIFLLGFGILAIPNAEATPEFSFEFGSFGSGQGEFKDPYDVTTDSNDRIIVAERNNNRIQVFDSTDTFQFMFGFGVDTGAAAFEVCTSTCQAGISGSGQGQFSNLRGVTTDSNDRIIVSDFGNHRIQVFDSTGAFDFEFDSSGSSAGQFNRPIDVTTDSNDRIIVADTSNDRMQVFELITVHVGDVITIGDQTINADLTVDADTLFVDSATNFVGIGTATPEHALDVSRNMTGTTILVHNTGGSAGAVIRLQDDVGGADWKIKAKTVGDSRFVITQISET